MSIVTQKRLQQGVFEALASQNRFPGSGGGSGLAPIQLLGSTQFVATRTTSSTSFVAISDSVMTVPLARTQRVLCLATFTGSVQGTSGQFGYVRIAEGSPLIAESPFGVYDKSIAAAHTTTLFTSDVLPPGNVTIELDWKVDNAALTMTLNDFYLAVFQIGY